MNLEMTILLRIAGLMCLGLVAATVVGSKRFNYAGSLEKAETIVRQIFYVHCCYIVMIVGGLAVLCLGWPELLLAEGMGRVLCGFFALFWASRVVVQLTYYDKKLRAKERGWDLFFLGVFLALTVIFTMGGFVK